jgi:L-malate glycosyltransferase
MASKKLLNIGITCFPTFGGSGVVATEIGKVLANRGHRVHFIANAIPGRLTTFTENIFFHEVESLDYPLFTHTPYALNLASKMVEVSTYEKLDILHVHYAIPHATSAYLAKQILSEIAPKIITTLHGTDITLVGSNRSYLPITRFSIAQSDGVTTPSHSLRMATYDKLNLSTNKQIEVIPNFVDIHRFKPASFSDISKFKPISGVCPSDDKTKIISHVSNFRPLKRVDDVIKIFALIQKQIPAHLVLIGDGPERSTAEKLVRDLELEKKVCFLGKQESFVDILQRSHLFLLPSESESFGLAALEAMSCGVPVVASNIQGIPEVVVHAKTGFLVNVGDVSSMADFSIQLLKNEPLHQSFSSACRKRAEEEFEEKTICSRYEDYYYKILGL